MTQSHTLRAGRTEITVLSIGAVVQSWTVDGLPVVLGYADPNDYKTNPNSMGFLIGRVANRITGAQITVEGETYELPRNDGDACLHGGPGGFGWQEWDLIPLSDRAVQLRLTSPHLDQGFPGQVQAEVTMTLTDDGTLTYTIEAQVDRVTPLNLAQHLYFNLMGTGEVRGHVLQINAAHYTPTNADLTPTGQIEPVEDTRYDFRQPTLLAAADPRRRGHDGNLVLTKDGPAAMVEAYNGLRLTLVTDQPCLQLYTAPGLGVHGTPLPGPEHAPFAGFCLEAQGYPDALTHGFPSILQHPNRPYRQTTSIQIAQ